MYILNSGRSTIELPNKQYYIRIEQGYIIDNKSKLIIIIKTLNEFLILKRYIFNLVKLKS